MEFFLDLLTVVILIAWCATFPAIVDRVCKALGLR